MRSLKVSALFAIAALGIPALAGAETWREQSARDVPLAGIGRLRVENARGKIHVTRGKGSELHVTALKIARSNDSRWARRVLDETRVVAENHDGEYTVRVMYPQRQTIQVRFWDLFSDFELPRIEVQLALEVPDDMPVWLKSTSGDIASDDVRGSQRLESTSGDVAVNGATSIRVVTTSGNINVADSGPSEIKSVSGDVVADRNRGPLSVTTTSGTIHVHQPSDSLVVSTVSGDLYVDDVSRALRVGTTSGGVDVRRASGRVAIESASGDVGVGLDPPLERADISTSSGDVRLKLAQKLGCALDLGTSNGEIHAEVPLEVKNVTQRKLTGLVRHGTVPLVVRTSSGDINVSEGAR